MVPLVEREMSVIGTQPPPPERDVDVCWSLWEYVMMYVCMLALGGGEVHTHYTLHTLHTAHCTHCTHRLDADDYIYFTTNTGLNVH